MRLEKLVVGQILGGCLRFGLGLCLCLGLWSGLGLILGTLNVGQDDELV